jgi:hypothetical protein
LILQQLLDEECRRNGLADPGGADSANTLDAGLRDALVPEVLGISAEDKVNHGFVKGSVLDPLEDIETAHAIV